MMFCTWGNTAVWKEERKWLIGRAPDGKQTGPESELKWEVTAVLVGEWQGIQCCSCSENLLHEDIWSEFLDMMLYFPLLASVRNWNELCVSQQMLYYLLIQIVFQKSRKCWILKSQFSWFIQLCIHVMCLFTAETSSWWKMTLTSLLPSLTG